MSYKITTAKGYDFFEVSSAFQKSIRRGMEEEAIYWGLELFESNFAEYAFKRMIIMTSEDIGLAEPNMPANIQALFQNFDFLRKKKDTKKKPERVVYMHAIMMLVRAKKSRVVDNALIYFHEKHKASTVRSHPIPEYTFDQHTYKGKRMGRGFRYFMEEGSKLENMGDVEGEEEYYEKAYSYIKLYDNKLF